MRHSIRTTIRVKASSSTIWKVLTDTPSYKEWNPFITKITGDLIQGKKIKAEIAGSTFNPILLEVKENRSLRWLGKLFVSGLFNGEHIFEIEEEEDGFCTLHHGENFSGILVGLLKNKLDNEVTEGFESMNRALKQRCETIESRRHAEV